MVPHEQWLGFATRITRASSRAFRADQHSLGSTDRRAGRAHRVHHRHQASGGGHNATGTRARNTHSAWVETCTPPSGQGLKCSPTAGRGRPRLLVSDPHRLSLYTHADALLLEHHMYAIIPRGHIFGAWIHRASSGRLSINGDRRALVVDLVGQTDRLQRTAGTPRVVDQWGRTWSLRRPLGRVKLG